MPRHSHLKLKNLVVRLFRFEARSAAYWPAPPSPLLGSTPPGCGTCYFTPNICSLLQFQLFGRAAAAVRLAEYQAGLIERLDAIIAELAELRAQVAASTPPTCNGLDASDDFAPEHLIDTHAAAERFSHPRDTVAKWCREDGCGIRRGARWLVSIPRLQRHLNGK